MKLKVESLAAPGHGEEPRAFFLGERRVAVRDILDRWPALEHSYFKIIADDGATYILRHDEPAGEWELTLFQAPAK